MLSAHQRHQCPADALESFFDVNKTGILVNTKKQAIPQSSSAKCHLLKTMDPAGTRAFLLQFFKRGLL